MSQSELRENVGHNFRVNVIDGAFFGLGALGLASSVTVLPLFLNAMGASAFVIGLVGSLHAIGWQLPQLFTSGYVSRLRRYKPMVVFMTFHERWPFFGLALLALLWPTLGADVIIPLTLLLLFIYGLGGGLAGTAWQSMIGKIIPTRQRGTFFGIQSAAANLLGAGGAVAAGIILERLPSPTDFIICFTLAGIALMISMGFLALTREPKHDLPESSEARKLGFKQMREIVQRDRNFRWFLLVRGLTAFGWMAVSFYTIYAVRRFGMTEATAGILTSIMTLSQTVANPTLGWLGDRFGHRSVYAFGALLMLLSAGIALLADSIGWFYLAFGLAGMANATFWAVAITLTLDFGAEHERPLYIGLTNTLAAPAALFTPIIGGFLATNFGFESTFIASVIACAFMGVILQFVMVDPRPKRRDKVKSAPSMVAAVEDSGVW
jgi:MFS family permease